MLVTGAVLSAMATGRAQGAAAATVADPLATFKSGQWIKLLASAPGASPAPCTQLKLLTGDFLDDDWALRGTVKTVGPERREFTIGECRVQVTDNTTYDSPNRNFEGYSDLRPGSYVEVEGTFLKNRTFLAAEVDDESDELARQPKMKDQIEMVGRLERVDPRRGIITIMGCDFQVTSRTQLRSVIR